MSNEIVIFWENNYPICFNDRFGKNNIYHELHEYSENGKVKLNSCQGLIILCELNINEKNIHVHSQDFPGIKLAQDLRLIGSKVPILFTSFLTRRQIYSNKPEREIINAIGHDFIRLPANPQEFVDRLEQMNSLSDLELYDIQNSYCRKEGMIRELAHRLSNIKYFDLGKKSSNEVRAILNDSIRQISGVYNENPIDFITILNNKYSEISEKNISDAVAEISRYGERLISEYSPVVDIQPAEKKRKWKLLWLDDESDSRHKLISFFRGSNVEVILCSSALDAQQKLEEDWKGENRINVIVADYRLYFQTEEGKVHQPIQGYTFLKQISELGKMIKLVALSALPRKFLLHSFKHYNVAAQIYSKKDYLEDDNTLKLLCTELVELGDENEEAISRLPRITSEYWKYFEPFYTVHRNSLEYKKNEEYISEKARIYCEGLLHGEYKSELSGYTVALGEEKTLAEAKDKKKKENEKEQNVGNNGKDYKKRKIYSASEKYIVYKDTSNKKYFEEFINKMICRRVAIWYTQYNPFYSLKDVHKILKGKKYQGSESDVAARNQVNTNLALSLNEFPWNMTIEEKNWLLNVMKFKDIERIEKNEIIVLNAILQEISAFLKRHNLDNLSNNEEFSRFFIGSRPIYTSNIVLCKTFLYKLYNYLRDKKSYDLIKDLYNEIIIWNFINDETDGLKKINTFLGRLINTLRLTKPVNENAQIIADEREIDYSEVVRDVISKITEYFKYSKSPESEAWEKEELKTNAILFYHDETIEKKNFHSQKEWVDALFKYHKKQFNELSNSIGCPYDDIKVRSKKKKTDPSDNE